MALINELAARKIQRNIAQCVYHPGAKLHLAMLTLYQAQTIIKAEGGELEGLFKRDCFEAAHLKLSDPKAELAYQLAVGYSDGQLSDTLRIFSKLILLLP